VELGELGGLPQAKQSSDESCRPESRQALTVTQQICNKHHIHHKLQTGPASKVAASDSLEFK